jgi:serine phosphatase RsbU (regulator of sigma subunit)
MFIIYITILLVTAFFLIFNYYNQLSLQESRQYDKLKAIVTSTAVNLNGDSHQLMMANNLSPDDINSPESDSIYHIIKTNLSKAVSLNNLNSAMYTLIYDEDKDQFYYGVRSDDFVDYRNQYKKYPKALKERMNVGGTIPMYETENGIWLSAFYPIKNAKNEVVAILEADVDFTEFKAMVNSQYLKQALIALAVVLLITFILIPYSRRILNEDERKKRIFLQQKLIIEQSHKEIKASMTYAKRIQSAILPSLKLIQKNIEQSFVLYKPKDIVAGDFYWMEFQGLPKNEVLFAACDCTGHGIPGAMVSVICNNALNRAAREYKLTEPGVILDKSREIVIEEFEKSDDIVKDGMDISLVHIKFIEKEGTKKTSVKWAGANNPLWVLRNDEDTITQLKPNKQPVGVHSKSSAFTTHSLELNEGDLLYLFTDGYQDQFGGVDFSSRQSGGKKFKAVKLKELLVSIRNESMEQQKEILDKKFEEWRGGLEQVDDVCVIGVRL